MKTRTPRSPGALRKIYAGWAPSCGCRETAGMIFMRSKSHRRKLRYAELVSTGPGTLAGRFMRRFWHPVYRAEEVLAGQAKPIEIMGERFTLTARKTVSRTSPNFVARTGARSYRPGGSK